MNVKTQNLVNKLFSILNRVSLSCRICFLKSEHVSIINRLLSCSAKNKLPLSLDCLNTKLLPKCFIIFVTSSFLQHNFASSSHTRAKCAWSKYLTTRDNFFGVLPVQWSMLTEHEPFAWIWCGSSHSGIEVQMHLSFDFFLPCLRFLIFLKNASQLFNIRSNNNNLILWWDRCGGKINMVFISKSRTLFVQSCVVTAFTIKIYVVFFEQKMLKVWLTLYNAFTHFYTSARFKDQSFNLKADFCFSFLEHYLLGHTNTFYLAE